jgi:hypothetical protein
MRNLFGLLLLVSVIPLMSFGYCVLWYPLGRFVSPYLASLWLWIAVTSLMLWAVYRVFLRDEGDMK